MALFILPKEALRVVAIGVQGLMNRSPGKTAMFLVRDQGHMRSTFPRSVEVNVYEQDDRTDPRRYRRIISILMQKKIDEMKGATLLAYDDGKNQWYDAHGFTFDEFDRWPKKTQKEAEAMAAVAFTAPYRVEHVCDEALQAAKTVTDRWRSW